jgi:hypothetical protein
MFIYRMCECMDSTTLQLLAKQTCYYVSVIKNRVWWISMYLNDYNSFPKQFKHLLLTL